MGQIAAGQPVAGRPLIAGLPATGQIGAAGWLAALADSLGYLMDRVSEGHGRLLLSGRVMNVQRCPAGHQNPDRGLGQTGRGFCTGKGSPFRIAGHQQMAVAALP